MRRARRSNDLEDGEGRKCVTDTGETLQIVREKRRGSCMGYFFEGASYLACHTFAKEHGILSCSNYGIIFKLISEKEIIDLLTVGDTIVDPQSGTALQAVANEGCGGCFFEDKDCDHMDQYGCFVNDFSYVDVSEHTALTATIERLKHDGEVKALKEELTRLGELVKVNTWASVNGVLTCLGDSLKSSAHAIEQMQAILTALQELEPGNK